MTEEQFVKLTWAKCPTPSEQPLRGAMLYAWDIITEHAPPRYLVHPPGGTPFFWADFDPEEPHPDDLTVYDLEAGLFTNDGGQTWAAIEK
jgi:hypothetical protein